MSTLNFNEGQYVKFVRVTAANWALVTAALKNDDTLYFVLAADGVTGSLYLGSRLIAGGISGSTSLSSLTDVVLGANLPDNSILIYESNDQLWHTMELSDLVNMIVNSVGDDMVGATASANGVHGLVPAPLAGEQAHILLGNGEWVAPATIIQPIVNNKLSTVFGADWDSTNQIVNGSKTVRQIAAEEVATIVANAPAALDTLAEIAAWVGTPESANAVSLLSRITTLENTVVNGIPADPEHGIEATSSLITKVGNLNDALLDLEDRMDDAEDRLDNLENTIKWQDLTVSE